MENKSEDVKELLINKEDSLKLVDFGFTIDKVILIESSESHVDLLKLAFEEINKSDIIGLDSEWVKTKHPIKSIIFQIATRDKAYIFDLQPTTFVQYLNKQVPSNHDFFDDLFETLLGQTFLNEKVLKVAWDFDLDLRNLNNRFSKSKNKRLKEINNIIDLMPVAPKSIEKGFSNHCLFFLNKKLDKTNQVCAWDFRPLTEDKLIYAALDAIAAIPLYEKMKKSVEMTPSKLDLVSVDERMKEWKMKQKDKFKFDKWEV